MYTQNENSLYEEHKNLITGVIRKNRPLLSALRLEFDDVSQHLSITLLSAIRKFDPDRSTSLAAHIRCSLQYEILNIKRRFRPHGITGVPKGYRPDFLYLDGVLTDGGVHDLPSDDDMTAIEFSELFDSLSEREDEALDMRLQGFPVRRKVHTEALDTVRHRYSVLYA